MTQNPYAMESEKVRVWMIVWKPSGVKSLVLQGRIEDEDTSDGGGCCLWWRWCNSRRINSADLNQPFEEVRAEVSVYCDRERSERSDALRWWAGHL